MAKKKNGGRVMDAYLDMKRPYEVTLPVSKFGDPTVESPYIQYAKNNGYDRVIFKNDAKSEIEKNTYYVVFSSTQIKSASDNVGTYDKANPDIRYSMKGSEDAKDVAALRKENDTLLTEAEIREKHADQNAKSARAVGKARAELRAAVRRDAGARLRASGAPESMAEPLTRLLELAEAGRTGYNAIKKTVVEEGESYGREREDQSGGRGDQAVSVLTSGADRGNQKEIRRTWREMGEAFERRVAALGGLWKIE